MLIHLLDWLIRTKSTFLLYNIYQACLSSHKQLNLRGMSRQWCRTDIKCGYASVWLIFFRMRSKTCVALLVSTCTWIRSIKKPQMNKHLFLTWWVRERCFFSLPTRNALTQPAHHRSAASQSSLNAWKCHRELSDELAHLQLRKIRVLMLTRISWKDFEIYCVVVVGGRVPG